MQFLACFKPREISLLEQPPEVRRAKSERTLLRKASASVASWLPRAASLRGPPDIATTDAGDSEGCAPAVRENAIADGKRGVVGEALFDLQINISDIAGSSKSWAARAQETLGRIADTVSGELRLYGVAQQDGSASPPFVLVASSSSSGMQTQPKAYEGAPTELQEGSPRSPLEGTPAAAASPVQGAEGSPQVPLLVGALLDRMVETRAPVVRHGTWGHPQDVTIAVVPLNTGRQLEGALCIVRKASPLPSAANGAPAGPAPCPDLLSDPSALMQLGLCVSLALLAGESGQQFRVLCEGLHALSTANSMQQLVGALCQAVAANVQEQYLLTPRVTAALVPKPGASTGLMFACRGPSELPGPRAAGNDAGSKLNVRRNYAATDFGRCHDSATRLGTAHDVTAVEEEPPGRCQSDSSPRNLVPDSPPACRGADIHTVASGPAEGGYLQPTAGRGAASLFKSGRAGFGGQSQVIPLGNTSKALLDFSEAGLASQAAPELHVKPFPLAQTLLGHLSKGDGGNAAFAKPSLPFAAEVLSAGTAKAPAAVAAPRRPRALVVEDCAAHVQDPRRPSRDVLMLMAGSNQKQQPALARQALGLPSPTAGNGSPRDPSASPLAALGRSVQSLITLLLPSGDGRCAFGLYVAFPQHLPRALLDRIRDALVELLKVASPLVAHKLQFDLAVEVETLATATPGSYAVVDGAGSAAVTSGYRTTSLHGYTPPANTVFATAEQLLAEFNSVADGDEAHALGTRDCLLPMMLLSSGGASLLGSASLSARRDVRNKAAVASSTMTEHLGGGAEERGMGTSPFLTMGVGSSVGGRLARCMPQSDPALDGAGLLRATDMPGLASKDHGPQPALNTAEMADCAWSQPQTHAVIHVEDMDEVKHSMRSQMPTLVASLRSSIGAARADVAAAAAARDTQAVGSLAPASGTSRLGRTSQPLTSDASALAGIELLSQLGHGGCAVVLMGRMGVMDVAVKLMELPEMDDEDTATGLARASTANSGNMCPRAALTPSGQKRLGARRALLRNAMELAVMTSLTGHPNVLQVYTTFSNVALVRTQKPDGSVTLKLRPADKANPVAEDALDDDTPPVCDCLVAEWCDRGCLAKALASKAVPGTVVVRPADGSGPPRQVPNYKVILMTLLDVVLALRHLHSHNLIHRDLKPGNVLLRTSNTDPRGFTAKLADFGFVTLLNKPGDDASNGEPFAIVEEACGTVTHMSPESMEEGARIGPSCDVYSLGILMWDMVAGGTRPYAELQHDMVAAVVMAGARPAFPTSVPSSYRRLAERCWATDPLQRPYVAELIDEFNSMLAGNRRQKQ
ncbi:hypothetical protein HYH03_007759 [Edaphochlamys debaryana]|uniref:Protein kinase domain-containing protein n=1 Tax=Edaphochlamys debaryana TaxID=47281 RepID=A0A835Y4Q9_9CHLO|nr:hypothetical protein HYH03_007759 [Edaphochlamys debaryana]|eukprot:KAG2494121.1 hypothetical protein HYH03_007759 [Edaphochlamys debaryana]